MADIVGARKLELLFRRAAELDVGKSDLKRLDEFIDHKVADLMRIAQKNAKANERDMIHPWDVPITQGLENSIAAFRELSVDLDLEPILERLTAVPELNLSYAEETRERLPVIVGALTISLAHTFKVLDPELKNPQGEHWDRASQIFDMLL